MRCVVGEELGANRKSPGNIDIAVLFLIYKRINATKKSFDAIRKARPKTLFIAGDGARENNPEERANVEHVRSYVLKSIDWECEVHTKFNNENYGSKVAVSEAIGWFFDNVEMGIIIEDDIVPSISFFEYCLDLLERFKNDISIGVIGGYGVHSKEIQIPESYAAIKYPLTWGWASWRRVWEEYDVQMKTWPATKKRKFIKEITNERGGRVYWRRAFKETYNGEIDAWDYQLCLQFFKNNLKCIVPSKNLISNVGFGEDATHTSDPNDSRANMVNEDLEFPLIHPKDLNKFSKVIEQYYDKNDFRLPTIYEKLWMKIKRITRFEN